MPKPISPFRGERMTELVKTLAARFLELESSRTSLITVTDVKIDNNMKEATIYFTVFPETSEESALNFAKRKRSEFKHFVKKESKLPRIPYFDFEIDRGEKNRQLIEEISQKVL